MDMLPDETQTVFQNSVRNALAQFRPRVRADIERVERTEAIHGLAWRQEWLGLDHESAAERHILLYELGRVLAPLSLVAHFVAVTVSSIAGEEAARDRLVSGQARAAFAMAPLGGEKDELLVLGDPRPAIAVQVEPERALLLSLSPDDCEAVASGFDPTTAVLNLPARSASKSTAVRGGESLIGASSICASYLAGMAEAVAETTIRHAATREQFGRPIGAFQAIKHGCVAQAVRSEAARCQSVMAAITLAGWGAVAEFQAQAARIVAAQAAERNAAEAIQIFGARGFMDENPLHLYLRRSHVFQFLLGGGEARLADFSRQARPDIWQSADRRLA